MTRPIDPTLEDNPPPEVSDWTRRGISGWRDPEMLQADPPRAAMRLDVLALMLGVSLGIWGVFVLGAIKFWPVIERAWQ